MDETAWWIRSGRKELPVWVKPAIPHIRADLVRNFSYSNRNFQTESASQAFFYFSGNRGPARFQAYLRGEASLLSHDGNRATAELQKFIDHRGLVGTSPWGALAGLGLSRAYATETDSMKARIAYQDF